MVLNNSGNTAFADMWDWSVENKKECAGFVLQNEKVYVYFYDKNKFRKSYLGKTVSCNVNNKEYFFPHDTELEMGGNETVFSYTITTSVHTHPAKDVKFDKINDDGIKANDLAVSDLDISTLSSYNLTFGLILSKSATSNKGSVFKFNPNSLAQNSNCPVIDYF